jgi:hypothetical protein
VEFIKRTRWIHLIVTKELGIGTGRWCEGMSFILCHIVMQPVKDGFSFLVNA